MDATDRFFAAVSRLALTNPFLPDLARREREVLGRDAAADWPVWSMGDNPGRVRANSWLVVARIENALPQLQTRVRQPTASPELRAIYEDTALFLLYHRFYARFVEASTGGRWLFYREFHSEWRQWFHGAEPLTSLAPAHAFACFWQVQRAFHHIFLHIIGSSLPAARLRAAVWQSIFTHDMRRYRRSLFERMGEFATLITGPSGSGKEVAARAIALSRYVPFDENRQGFSDDPQAGFQPINIAALSQTLLESELFGHRRGSFTGAVTDRKGWLEMCPPRGAVFLDEIGELRLDTQVKLLRVIESRTFLPVGDSKPRRFHGKLICATNRDLAAGIHAARFREDLYYRLCSDLIATPSLAEQIADRPEALHELIVFLSRRIAGEESEALAAEAETWIAAHLGPHYPWPGNYRELEQCLRNLLVRGNYRPVGQSAPAGVDEEWWDGLRHARWSQAELLRRYTTLVYFQTGAYETAARRLGVDRRTVKAHVDPRLLARLRNETAAGGAASHKNQTPHGRP